MDKNKGQQVANDFSDYVNNMCFKADDMADEIVYSTHRTLQQSMFKVILTCIKKWSDMYDKNMYDARNEFTCQLCNKIYKQFEEEMKYIPFI